MPGPVAGGLVMKLARGAGHAITPDDDMAVALARGGIHALKTFQVKGLGAGLLGGVLALGGHPTLARPPGATGLQDRAESRPDQPADALNRSVEKLQSERDESARRNAEMRKTPQEKRSDLKAQRVGQPPPPVKGAATRF